MAGSIMGQTAVATPHRPGGSSGTTQTMMHLLRGARDTTQTMMPPRHGGSGTTQMMMRLHRGSNGTTRTTMPPHHGGSGTTQTTTPPHHGGIDMMRMVVRHQRSAGSGTVQMTATHRPPGERQGRARASAAPLPTSARRASAPRQRQQLHRQRTGNLAACALPAVQAQFLLLACCVSACQNCCKTSQLRLQAGRAAKEDAGRHHGGHGDGQPAD